MKLILGYLAGFVVWLAIALAISVQVFLVCLISLFAITAAFVLYVSLAPASVKTRLDFARILSFIGGCIMLGLSGELYGRIETVWEWFELAGLATLATTLWALAIWFGKTDGL